MIVLDASAAVDWLLQTSAGQSIEKRICSRSETLHAPHLLDLEVAQVLRRLALQGVVSIHRAAEAVSDLLDLYGVRRTLLIQRAVVRTPASTPYRFRKTQPCGARRISTCLATGRKGVLRPRGISFGETNLRRRLASMPFTASPHCKIKFQVEQQLRKVGTKSDVEPEVRDDDRLQWIGSRRLVVTCL